MNEIKEHQLISCRFSCLLLRNIQEIIDVRFAHDFVSFLWESPWAKSSIAVLALDKEKFCEKYLFEFLKQLAEKLDEPNAIDDHFNSWIFADDDEINQTSCTGLTLMHVNVLGGECAWC